MPCRSGFEDEPVTYIVDKHLQPDLDKVTALLCSLSMFLGRHHVKVLEQALKDVPEFESWLTKHQASDAQRWYKHYRGMYPNFSLDEIAKMVRNGILEVP